MTPVEIIVTPLDAEPASIERLAAALSQAERARAARLRFGAQRRRYIATRAKLHELLAARCGAPSGTLRLEEGRHGKPALAGSRLQFSLSRSASLAAFAFARDRAVGIDLEAIRPLAEADAIAEQAFPWREWRAYAALPAHARLRAFFRGWTRTEALAKALGRGLGAGRETLDAAQEGPWLVRSFCPAAGFVAALALERRGVS
jgi:4'-phosphopantetheinyl transferase